MARIKKDPSLKHILDEIETGGSYCYDEVICAVCDTEQPIRKQQFHCDDCRICRVGGQENYFHCEKCGSSTARSVGLVIQLHYVTIIVWRTSWACALLMLLLLDMFETIDIENFYI
ncbi:hypothetical protein HN51_066594 [Arachis hypogaea]|uniref:CTCHY-type domain-containing protein n=1 Tax=Arachis hypogaea TaxID=3818 RepID=A0A444ZJR5_ARAHY|nr:hypothetical protein Ahy_B04g071031 isoform A [Arachis hypogaea]